MTNAPELSKADVALHWIASGWIRIHFDATRDGVTVPDHLRHQQNVVLEIGFDMPEPIRDLRIDQEGFSGTLRFGTTPGRVEVPWSATYMIALTCDEQVALWWADVPEPLRSQMVGEAGERANARIATRRQVKPPHKVKPKSNHLRLVKR